MSKLLPAARAPSRRSPVIRLLPHCGQGRGAGRGAGQAAALPAGVWQAERALPTRAGWAAWRPPAGGAHGHWGLPSATLAATRDPCALPPVQPDPPVNVTVTPVARNPRWLSVTWQDAPSWNSHFYRLQFELRYRAEKSKAFTTLLVSPPFAAAQRGAPDPRPGRHWGRPGPHAPPGPGRL